MNILLTAGELLDLGSGNRSVTLRCDEGCCWVTVENDSRDLILRPGRTLPLPQRRVIVTAMRDSRVELCRVQQERSCSRSYAVKRLKKNRVPV